MRKVLTGLVIGGLMVSCSGGGGGGSSEGEVSYTKLETKGEAVKITLFTYSMLSRNFVFTFSNQDLGKTSIGSEEGLILKIRQAVGSIRKMERGRIDCDYGGYMEADIREENGETVGTLTMHDCATEKSIINGTAQIRWVDRDKDEDYEYRRSILKEGFTIRSRIEDLVIRIEGDFEVEETGDINGEMTGLDRDRLYLRLDGGPIVADDGKYMFELGFNDLVVWINTYNPVNADIEYKIDGMYSVYDELFFGKEYRIKVSTLEVFKKYFLDRCEYSGRMNINDGQVKIRAYSPDDNVHDPNNVEVEIWTGEKIFDDNCTKIEDLI